MTRQRSLGHARADRIEETEHDSIPPRCAPSSQNELRRSEFRNAVRGYRLGGTLLVDRRFACGGSRLCRRRHVHESNRGRCIPQRVEQAPDEKDVARYLRFEVAVRHTRAVDDGGRTYIADQVDDRLPACRDEIECPPSDHLKRIPVRVIRSGDTDELIDRSGRRELALYVAPYEPRGAEQKDASQPQVFGSRADRMASNSVFARSKSSGRPISSQ